MNIYTASLLVLISLASSAIGQQCVGNTSVCPGGKDGVSPVVLQCDSWSKTFVPINCPSGLVCYANPTKAGTAICNRPGSGAVPGQGKCVGNVAKCSGAPGQSANYFQCDSWAGHFVDAKCPAGLRCYNNAGGSGVICA
ncbi:hypothetical protein LPJ66_000025 [Kickxella alabastrina]|uniref:Uncharacterized protein n=1 Tax=Kickxella alabastrina TaxID=61397 RepID=A0ACC1IXE8_9FUNG|nr:hypothetical protein LPJ66_000025 [Kickxella alabastrina]